MSGAESPGRLRILWVASKLTWAGGIGRVLEGACRALAERGHEIHVAGPAPDGEPAPIPGVFIHPWPVRRWKLQNLPPLVALQREIQAQVLHFHAALAAGEVIAPFVALRRWLGSPAVFVTPHTAARTHYPKRRARFGIRVADAVLTPSLWSARHAIAVGAREADTYEVYAGIESTHPVTIGVREPAVLMLGRLLKVKGADILIEAFDRATVDRREWRLLIGGDGRELEALREQANQCAARDRIEFLGHVSGVAKSAVLERASIGVVPSLRESFGGVLLEFQAHGLACIATNAGGMAEIADGGRAARQVSPGDIDALAKALWELMDDPELRRSLSAGALDFAKRMSWSATARRYEDIYARYLAMDR